jgi:Bacterial archaeo-eukaryotic release factor family 7
MDRITMNILKQAFLNRHSGWCVSLFMPTHRAGRDMEQDPIRFKNLLREAEERLTEKGLRPSEVQELLKEPRRLLQDRGFWQRQSDGLAVFFSADRLHFFRLPMAFKELVVVSHRFHVKPLLPILASDGLFYTLALSQNQVRLLEGTRHTVDEIELEAMAQSLSEAFPEVSIEKQLQFHTGTPSGKGSRAAMFHGHDVSNETKDRILRWFRMIDRHLHDLLPDGQSPLVLAGVDSLFPIYREANTYPHLMEGGIPGNPESLKPEELHGQAWALVEPVFKKAREESAARYHQLAGTGQTTTDVKETVSAAYQGRVDVLFVAVGVQVWGRFDSENERVYVHDSPEPGDDDLLDLAAIQSLLKGGTVYAVLPEKVPDQALLAAVLRY